MVIMGYGVSGSASYSKSKVNADYASVNEQSGIFAGEDGYKSTSKDTPTSKADSSPPPKARKITAETNSPPAHSASETSKTTAITKAKVSVLAPMAMSKVAGWVTPKTVYLPA